MSAALRIYTDAGITYLYGCFTKTKITYCLKFNGNLLKIKQYKILRTLFKDLKNL